MASVIQTKKQNKTFLAFCIYLEPVRVIKGLNLLQKIIDKGTLNRTYLFESTYKKNNSFSRKNKQKKKYLNNIRLSILSKAKTRRQCSLMSEWRVLFCTGCACVAAPLFLYTGLNTWEGIVSILKQTQKIRSNGKVCGKNVVQYHWWNSMTG